MASRRCLWRCRRCGRDVRPTDPSIGRTASQRSTLCALRQRPQGPRASGGGISGTRRRRRDGSGRWRGHDADSGSRNRPQPPDRCAAHRTGRRRSRAGARVVQFACGSALPSHEPRRDHGRMGHAPAPTDFCARLRIDFRARVPAALDQLARIQNACGLQRDDAGGPEPGPHQPTQPGAIHAGAGRERTRGIRGGHSRGRAWGYAYAHAGERRRRSRIRAQVVCMDFDGQAPRTQLATRLTLQGPFDQHPAWCMEGGGSAHAQENPKPASWLFVHAGIHDAHAGVAAPAANHRHTAGLRAGRPRVGICRRSARLCGTQDLPGDDATATGDRVWGAAERGRHGTRQRLPLRQCNAAAA